MLLDRGADPVPEEGAVCSPEYHAVRNQHMDVVEHLRNFCSERADRLAEHTAAGTLSTDSLFPSDLSSVNSEGQTLLMVAVIHNHPNLVRKLLQMKGMSKHIKDFKDLQVRPVCATGWEPGTPTACKYVPVYCVCSVVSPPASFGWVL